MTDPTDTCAKCGNERRCHGLWPTYVATAHKQIYDLGHPFIAACPNVDDPVLCKIHDGAFIPEAGCPVHDAEVPR